MGISELLNAEQGGIAAKNRVDLVLDVLSETERIELEEILFNLNWTHAAITRAIPKAYGAEHPEANQLKQTSVREWRVKKGLV